MIPKSSSANTSNADSSVGALVQYDDEGQVILGMVIGAKKEKLIVFNIRGREVELAPNRLYFLPGKAPGGISTSAGRMEALRTIAESIEQEAASLDVQEVWGFVHDQPRSYQVSELCEEYFGAGTCAQHAGLRLALIRERIHFKRDKDTFEPRPPHVVEEVRKAEEAKARKKALREATLAFVVQRAADTSLAIPHELLDTLELVKEIAASVMTTDPARQKEGRDFAHACGERLGLAESLPIEKKAFEVLQKLGIFHEHTNLSCIRHNISVLHSAGATAEGHSLVIPSTVVEYPDAERVMRRDATQIRCFTIDDASTRDMDDALSLEQTPEGFELGIHITDATLSIQPDSVLDRAARRRATSIYCADQTINMLPESLSEDKLSLIVGSVRPCLSVFVTLAPNFDIVSSTVVPSFIRVSERYSYEQVDELLEQGDSTLLVLHDMAAAFEENRIRQGATRVHKREVIPIFEDGRVRLQEIHEESPARMLVSEMMVLANSIMARRAIDYQLPVLFRGQERPDDEVIGGEAKAPEGPAKDFSARSKLKKSSVSFEPQYHAGLGLSAYIQATSPIRRYLDLCHQRQFISFFRDGHPWVTKEEFEQIVAEIEVPLQEATVCSRETKRYWLLRYLEQRGRSKPIEGTVVRTDLKTPLVELDEVYLTTLIRLRQTPKLGQRVTVKLSAIDPHADYVRFVE